jgi:hypothetical protein
VSGADNTSVIIVCLLLGTVWLALQLWLLCGVCKAAEARRKKKYPDVRVGRETYEKQSTWWSRLFHH